MPDRRIEVDCVCSAKAVSHEHGARSGILTIWSISSRSVSEMVFRSGSLWEEGKILVSNHSLGMHEVLFSCDHLSFQYILRIPSYCRDALLKKVKTIAKLSWLR